MSKQTRLSFSKPLSSKPSKRRKLNSDDEGSDHGDTTLRQAKSTAPSGNMSKRTRVAVPGIAGSAFTKASVSSDTKETDTTESKSNPKASNGTTSSNKTHLTLTYHKASLFNSPPSTVLCHATNAQGTWGAGIAAAFKKNYPAASKIYTAHCSAWKSSSLLGTTFLIPPQLESPSEAERNAEHWIACLFTSEKKGKGKGSKESILCATGEAVADLVRQVKAVNHDDAATAETEAKPKTGKPNRIVEVRMCKINSGLFGVPWEATSEVIEAVELEDSVVGEIAVYSMD